MTTIQATASSSTCSGDDSGREAAKHALNSARTVSGLAVIVKGDLQRRASFSPDPRATKSAPSKVEETAPSSSTLAETSSVEVPTAASTPDEPTAKREHPPLTEERVLHLLHSLVNQGMKSNPKGNREQWLTKATRRAARIIEKSAAEEDKFSCLQKLDEIDTHPGPFWLAHVFPSAMPHKTPSTPPKPAASKPQVQPEKKSAPMPKAETRKDEAKDDGQDLEIPDEIVAIPAPAPVVSPKPASSATERTAAPRKTELKPADRAPARPQTAQPPPQKPRLLLKKPLTTPGYVEEMVKYF